MHLRFPALLALFITVAGFVSADTLERRRWTVDGVVREALIRIPAKSGPDGAPLVFAFHGHGGTMQQASRSFPIHELWAEAIVVYPQGLPTVGQLMDPEGKGAGWQGPGTNGDRDLKFFDAMLADLRQKYHIDNRRIYATGHSNGGGFTYLLWAERGDQFAAFAPSSSVAGKAVNQLKAKPVLHIGSPRDPLVKFAWQEKMIDFILKLNGCEPRQGNALGYKIYTSTKGADVATYLHDGGHKYSAAAPELIVKFFQTHIQPASPPAE